MEKTVSTLLLYATTESWMRSLPTTPAARMKRSDPADPSRRERLHHSLKIPRASVKELPKFLCHFEAHLLQHCCLLGEGFVWTSVRRFGIGNAWYSFLPGLSANCHIIRIGCARGRRRP